MSLQSVFCLENRPREDEIVAWKSKAVGMSCLTYAILLRYFSRGRGGGGSKDSRRVKFVRTYVYGSWEAGAYCQGWGEFTTPPFLCFPSMRREESNQESCMCIFGTRFVHIYLIFPLRNRIEVQIS